MLFLLHRQRTVLLFLADPLRRPMLELSGERSQDLTVALDLYELSSRETCQLLLWEKE